jgi:hypothetical protein
MFFLLVHKRKNQRKVQCSNRFGAMLHNQPHDSLIMPLCQYVIDFLVLGKLRLRRISASQFKRLGGSTSKPW